MSTDLTSWRYIANSVLDQIARRYEYKLTREYNWNVKNKASKGYEVSTGA